MPPTISWQSISKKLRAAGVGVLPTDTLYGIVGSAFSKRAVRRIYRLRRRNLRKPMIILVGDLSDLAKFGIVLTAKNGPKYGPSTHIKKLLKTVWPGRVSVVLPIKVKKDLIKFSYLHRGTGSLAFRLPRPVWLRALLKKTGPLVAPSANFEGEPPATTIAEAKKYFGKHADFYKDAGRRAGKPSRLIAMDSHGHITVLRK